jgi:hypothetical protein
MKSYILLTGLLLLSFLTCLQPAKAQTPSDGLMMSRGYSCTIMAYTHSSWNQYWEGTRRRDNLNLGTVSTQSVMLMSAYGLTKRLNLIAGLPYVWTRTSAGNLAGQQGFQDVSAWVKYKALQTAIPTGKLYAFGTLGFSMPVSRYIPDFLPLSIGSGAKNAYFKGIVHYKSKPGWYLTVQGGYTWRSNIRIDRDSYQFDNKLYYTNEVQLPNVLDGSIRTGYWSKHFQTDLFLSRFISLSGDDIRRNDMPFPTNSMEATQLGLFAKYNWLVKDREFSLLFQVGHTLAGANVGQSTQAMAGIAYAFRVLPAKE